MLKQYYETNVDAWLIGLLLIALGVIGWISLAAGTPRLAIGWILVCAVCFFGCMRSEVMRRKAGPVLTISDDFMLLRGIYPGHLLWVSGWHTENIRYADIMCVKIGLIRELVGGAAHLPPLRVPFSSAGSMEFLWITYRGDDNQVREIYYPHVPRIRNYREAVHDLQRLAQSTQFHIILYAPYLSV